MFVKILVMLALFGGLGLLGYGVVHSGPAAGVGMVLALGGAISIPFVHQAERDKKRLDDSRKSGPGPGNPNNMFYRHPR